MTGVRTSWGDVRCEVVVNCGGQWARQFGALAGVNVPLYSAEHFYIVTDKIDGVHPMLPVMRDPDGFIYYKEEVGGLVMGGFEPQAKPWRVDPIPSDFEFQLLAEDWDQFEILMNNAIHRTPCLETAQVKMLLNGPESFTPDGNFILGEAPELRRYFVCAGFNSAGIANSGGAGRLIAEWIVGGEAPRDLWDVDIRRFGSFPANRKAPRRPHRRDARPALRDALAARGAGHGARRCAARRCTTCSSAKAPTFGSKNDWERANYFLPAGTRSAPAHGARHAGLAAVAASTSSAPRARRWRCSTRRRSASCWCRAAMHCAVLQRLCANEIDVPVGKHGLHARCSIARGGFESDLTVMRLGADRFQFITGSAQPQRDLDWIDAPHRRRRACGRSSTSAR